MTIYGTFNFEEIKITIVILWGNISFFILHENYLFLPDLKYMVIFSNVIIFIFFTAYFAPIINHTL